MHVVIFEDSHWADLNPLSISRPIVTLLCGASTLLEKQIRHTGATRVTLWVRPEMEAYAAQRLRSAAGPAVSVNAPLDDGPALLVNARALLLQPAQSEEGVEVDPTGAICLARVDKRAGLSAADALGETARWKDLLSLPRLADQTRLINRPWDFIRFNHEALLGETPHVPTAGDATIGPGAVLDDSKGPIILGQGAIIGANSVIEGPCYIGPQSQIMPLSLIRGDTSIGPTCKIGGEVSCSIVMGFSNKAHDGFLGHSYLGRWVNLGAGTTTSNLKNTYGQIRVRWAGDEINTGMHFLGSIIGDHAKTAIGTRLMAGTYVGFGSMLAMSAIAPRYTPHLKWVTDNGAEKYDVQKAMGVIQAVFARRHREWSSVDEAIVRYISAS